MRRARRGTIAAAVATLLWFAGSGFASAAELGPVGRSEGAFRAQTWRIPLPHDPSRTMAAHVLRPPGEQQRKLVVINHGSPVDAGQRAVERPAFAAAADWFVRRGYVVVRPIRRGYGETGGPWAETYRSCAEPDFWSAGLESAKDIRAAIDYMTRQPFVEPDGVVVVGQSAGGWGSLALAALNPPEVAAVVNFAGGRGGYAEGRANTNCAPDRLVAAAGAYGRAARMPSLWVYTANDGFFAPALSRRMYDAFIGNGGNGQYALLPSFGTDGHSLFAAPDGVKRWEALVERFLQANAAR